MNYRLICLNVPLHYSKQSPTIRSVISQQEELKFVCVKRTCKDCQNKISEINPYPTIFSGPNARNAEDVNASPSPIEKNANLPFDQG